MKKLFFIVPVYKVEKYLRRCVNSLITQSYENTEIVLIDDGSPDGCPKICDQYAHMHDNVTVIHQKNGGLSNARNTGLDYVFKMADEGDYITFVDSDDFIHESYSQRMISLMEQNDCDIIQCCYEKGGGDAFSFSPAPGRTFCVDRGAALLGYDLKSQVFAKIFKAQIFKTLRFPVGMLNEDEFVTYRAVWAARGIAFSSEKLFYYYQRPDSIMSDIAKKLKNNPHRYDYLTAYKERAEFFEKENEREQVRRTHEKVCTDIILRYCEQMYLKKDERDEDCVNGTYMRIYRESYAKMIKRRAIPIKRKLMYTAFKICPMSAVWAGKIFTLRK